MANFSIIKNHKHFPNIEIECLKIQSNLESFNSLNQFTMHSTSIRNYTN